MRFSSCYKTVKLSGFFWNQRTLRYNTQWCGWGGSSGLQKMLRFYYISLSDGMYGSRGNVKRSNFKKFKTQNIGLNFLEYMTPFISSITPWSWYMLLNIKLKNYVSLRYKLSLPTRGQRSRTNRQTVKKSKDIVTQRLLHEFDEPIFGYKKRKVVFLKKNNKPTKGSKQPVKTGAKGLKKTIRTKKKDIWR